MSQKEEIVEELQEEINRGKGCAVFDFGCYFPYVDVEGLTFDFSLGMNSKKDKKINHRYPNKYYQTISRTYGRKVSKIGYPYFVEFDGNENEPRLLCLKVGFEKNVITQLFPLQFNLTKEKPVCGLSLKYNFEKQQFYFESCEPIENSNGWTQHRWSNYIFENGIETTLMMPINKEDHSSLFVYQDVITPKACTMEKLVLI